MLTRPTPAAPRRALFPGGDGEDLHAPSKLARISSGRGWIDLLLRAWTSTAFLKMRWIWCARSASKGDQPARTPSSCGAKQRQSHAVYPSLQQRRDQQHPLHPPCAADLDVGAVHVASFRTQQIAHSGYGVFHRSDVAGRNALG